MPANGAACYVAAAARRGKRLRCAARGAPDTLLPLFRGDMIVSRSSGWLAMPGWLIFAFAIADAHFHFLLHIYFDTLLLRQIVFSSFSDISASMTFSLFLFHFPRAIFAAAAISLILRRYCRHY
jgi:hypothetical protein